MGVRELLKEHEKGVLRAAHPRIPFQGEYPPPGSELQHFCLFNYFIVNLLFIEGNQS